MIQIKKYKLSNTGYVYIIEDHLESGRDPVVLYEGKDGLRRHLTKDQQHIIYHLSINHRAPIPYDKLYEIYSGDNTKTVEEATKRATAMVSNINKLEPDGFKIIRIDRENKGYYIDAEMVREKTQVSDKNMPLTRSNWKAKDLVGDYVGFYLDQGGNGSIKGLFLRIEDEANILRAYAIHNLANLDPLKRKEASVREIHASLDKRIHGASKLFHGVVKGCENLAYIELEHASVPQKISIVLDLRSYLVFKKHEAVDRPYRGGLGLQCVLCDIQSNEATYASRIGFIRVDRIGDISLPLYDEEIKKQLSIVPHRTEFGPLKLDEDDDRNWYHWFTYR